MISTEHIVSTTPLVIRRRVKFGECDPAGVVYTIAFSEYVISASDLFYGSLFGAKPQHAKDEFGFGTPTRALEFDFCGSLRPDDEFDMTVTVADIRTRSYVLHIDARTPGGHDVFHAALTPICVARGERRSINIPAPFKAALETYRAACPAAQPNGCLIEDRLMDKRVYRIGQIVPSSNTTMETEIPSMLRAREGVRPDRFTFHSSRMRMHKVTKEELEAMNREGLRCAAELADARVDVMSTACLVAIMAMGLGYHRQVQRELTDVARANHCNAPVMTSAGALVEGLHIMGAKKIALLAPYVCSLTDLVVKYIENEGIEVLDAVSFEIPDNLDVGRRDPALLVEDVKRLKTTNADVVVLSACVQMQSLPAIQLVEDRLGIPVTSTAVCTTRRMLDHVGLEAVVPNAGTLLSGRYPARQAA